MITQLTETVRDGSHVNLDCIPSAMLLNMCQKWLDDLRVITNEAGITKP